MGLKRIAIKMCKFPAWLAVEGGASTPIGNYGCLYATSKYLLHEF